MADCLFCRISSGEARADRVFEDEHAVAFRDINPAGPTHILVIPRRHIATLADLVRTMTRWSAICIASPYRSHARTVAAISVSPSIAARARTKRVPSAPARDRRRALAWPPG